MKISSLFPVGFILLITACNKETTHYGPHSDDPFYGTSLGTTAPLLSPCSPEKNTTVLDGDTIKYTAFGDHDPYYFWEADWGVSALTEEWLSKNVHIDFAQEPESGKYVTADEGNILAPNQCIVGGLWWTGNMGLSLIADANDTVYVKKSSFGKYEFTFCDLHFTSTGNDTFEFTTSGNITIE
jgi:hypothetical protein